MPDINERVNPEFFYEMSKEEITKDEFDIIYPKLLTEDQHEVLDYIFEGYLSQREIAQEICKKAKILSCLQDKMLEDVFRYEEKEQTQLIKHSIEDAFKRTLAIEKVFRIEKSSVFNALYKNIKLMSRILANDQKLIQEFLEKLEKSKSIENIINNDDSKSYTKSYTTVRGRFANIYKKFYIKGSSELLKELVNHREELFSREAKDKLNIHGKDFDQFSNCEKINQEEYVKRHSIEQEIKSAFKALRQHNTIITLRIKGIKRVGKTCLLEQFIIPHAKQLGYCIVSLSLQREMKGFTNNDEEFFQHLCTCIKDKLKTSLQLLPQYQSYNLSPDFIEENLQFQKNLGGGIAFQEFLADMLRYTPENIPILLAFDHVEYIFQFSDVSNSFGAILRTIMDDQKKMFRNLFFVILYSTQNYAKLSIHHSPFDTIGVSYIVKDFDLDEVKELAKIAFPKSNPWGEEQLRELTELVGGYVYLLKRAFNDSKIQEPETILAELNTQSSIYRTLFYEYLETLNENEDLKKDFKRVVDADHPVLLGCHSSFLLERMGLIKLEGNHASPRCKLYRDYFRQELQS